MMPSRRAVMLLGAVFALAPLPPGTPRPGLAGRSEPADMGPDAFGPYIVSETAKFADIVRRAGVQPE